MISQGAVGKINSYVIDGNLYIADGLKKSVGSGYYVHSKTVSCYSSKLVILDEQESEDFKTQTYNIFTVNQSGKLLLKLDHLEFDGDEKSRYEQSFICDKQS